MIGLDDCYILMCLKGFVYIPLSFQNCADPFVLSFLFLFVVWTSLDIPRDWTYTSFDIPAYITPILYKLCHWFTFVCPCGSYGFLFRLRSRHDICYFASVSFIVCVCLSGLMIYYIPVFLVLYFG